MKNTGKKRSRKIILILGALAVLCVAGLGLWALLGSGETPINEVPTEEDYGYVNPDESRAQPDEGFAIDGVLDEEAYQKSNWLYLHNDDGGNNVDIAMTSYYGQKGMYFVYDVTESVPIYVNLNRASYLNSCIEMYFAPSHVTSLRENSMFEVDLLPTGDMVFKMGNGKGGYVNAASTDDIMAVLGATTKGGEVNTEDCYGYCLELFIPWDYMNWLGMDAEAMKDSFVYVDPAHITSHNYAGDDTSVDRYWYFYAQQHGASFNDVYQYFRFDANGVQGTVPITLTGGEHYTMEGDASVIPGMQTTVTITPDAGYGLSSILVNEEEYIQSAAYNKDGSVTLTLRGRKEGLTISAAAEAVSSGSRTLRGTVSLNGGVGLQDVLISYNGPQGEKPITLDGEGTFELTDLAQGYYTVIVEKEGFTPISRGIYLNRNLDVALVLERELFVTESGSSWILDRQNDGKLTKFGGSGVIMTEPFYNQFTVAANFRYDEELAQLYDSDFYYQQRSGIRMRFANGKYWRVDLMKENGKYIVQYAKTGESLFGWKVIHELTAAETAQYRSEKGIELKVVRDGQYANVYLGGKLLAAEKLDKEYISQSAQVGFEAWVANQELMEVDYTLSGAVAQSIRPRYFARPNGWVITQQYQGKVALVEGGRGDLHFADKYANMDLTITVRDQDDPANTAARNDVLLLFENEAHVSFGITSNEDGAWIQSLNNSPDNGKQICKRWAGHGELTAEEFAQYKGDGVKFRVLRIGTEVSLYIGDRLVKVVDLTQNDSGVKADTPARVTLRHYDDGGVKVEIPFTMTEALELVTVKCQDSKNGSIKLNKQSYVMGDTVVVSDGGDEQWYLTGLIVNGEPVELDAEGVYTFQTAEKEYTLQGVYEKRVFAQHPNWNLQQQNTGVISTDYNKKAGTGTGYVRTLDSYNQLTLTLKNPGGSMENFAVAGQFRFENGKVVNVQLCKWKTNYYIKSANAESIFGANQNYYKFSEKDPLAQKLESEGIALTLARIGTRLVLFIDGQRVEGLTYSDKDSLDLTKDKDGNDTGITAGMAAAVEVCSWCQDRKLTSVDIPFELKKEQPVPVTVTVKPSENGMAVPDKKTYLSGETVVLTGIGDEGYFCWEMKANGKKLAMKPDYTCAFTAAEASYTVEAAFDKQVFADHSGWNLLQQNEGRIITAVNGATGYVETIDSYNELILNVKNPGLKSFQLGVQFQFENGRFAMVQLLKWGDNYILKSASKDANSIYANGETYYKFPASSALGQKIESTDGTQLRMVRVGTDILLYLDGIRLDQLTVNGQTAGTLDLTVDSTGASTGITAHMPAKVKIASWCEDESGGFVTVPFQLKKEQPASVVLTVEPSGNGTVTPANEIYIVGDTVSLTAEGDEGYYCCAMELNGKTVTPDAKGVYSFTAAEDSYTAKGTFAKRIFADGSGWDMLSQNVGIIRTGLKADTGYAATIEQYSVLTMKLRDPDGSIDDFSVGIKVDLENDKFVSFQVYKISKNKYLLQSCHGSSLYGAKGWSWYADLTAEQIALLQGQNGLELKLAKAGTNLLVFLDGQRQENLAGGKIGDSFDLTHDSAGNATGITADSKATFEVRSWSKDGELDVLEIPFSLSKDAPAYSIVSTSALGNGTVTADKRRYLPGETVTLTVKPDETNGAGEHVCEKLLVNGEEVTLASDGTYSFKAQGGTNYTVSAAFKRAKFFKQQYDWNTSRENEGILLLNGFDGDSGWTDTLRSEYRDITLQVSDLTPTAQNLRMGVQFGFTNGKTFRISLTNADNGAKGVYKIQLMGSNNMIGNWGTVYQLTEAQIAKLQTQQGVAFRVAFVGAVANVYLDNLRVYSVDLTKDSDGAETGIADKPAMVTIRMYGNKGHDVQLPFILGGEPEKAVVTVSDQIKNGTVTLNHTGGFIVGEKVVLTATPESGYYQDLQVNGQNVILDWESGVYTFTAKAANQVTGTFGTQALVPNGNNSDWHLQNHLNGVIAQKSSVTNNAGWLLSSRTDYQDLDITLTIRSAGTGDKKQNDSRASLQIAYKNGKDDFWTSFSLLQSGTAYKICNRKGDCVPFTAYTLTAEEVALLQSDKGIALRVVRTGTTVSVYLDGKQIVTDLDLTVGGKYGYLKADTPMQFKIKRDDDPGALAVMEYVLN